MYIGWVRKQETDWSLLRHKVTPNVYEYHTVECVIFIQTAFGAVLQRLPFREKACIFAHANGQKV